MSKLGKSEQLIQSNDREIRATKVRISNSSLLKRALNLLYLIELAGINESTQSHSMVEKEEGIEGSNQDNNVNNEIAKRSRWK